MVKISGVGVAVPPKLLTNTDLEKMVETSDQWITERTGIKQRHIVEPGVTCSDLGAQASLAACAKAGISPKDVELIIFATVTPDMLLPATACLVQSKIGATNCWGFDLSIACSGFLYALQVGAQFVMSGCHKNVLVIGIDVMSSIIDYTDRQTCIIFGDGGGAVLLQPSESEEDGCFVDYLHEIDGSGGDFLCMPGGGSQHPATAESVANRDHFVKQDGPVVFKFATKRMPDLCVRLLARNNMSGKDVDVFVPHQANLRIIKSAVERLQMPMEKVIINIEQYGNTTAGTLPLALDTALQQGRLKKGDLVLFAAMGAGLSAGAALIRWGY
ncbi:MAG: ketoacyl-ACP synthase III [Candidatus Obscuribacter sp.]|nr:ketoacyl-ACP synthase III [Candidatus Obscuribacter sp.]MBK9201508.1 ketoacyl-ACP synthase III [Candidatus Obscuribacter sp.]MBK9619814.1 ketoacyl-ACP synthase III [Candidatus Obscuribacter sp.]MBL0188807.1 ketoacyl-ACP synthase III [Candidatus Obscuribacter sp.]